MVAACSEHLASGNGCNGVDGTSTSDCLGLGGGSRRPLFARPSSPDIWILRRNHTSSIVLPRSTAKSKVPSLAFLPALSHGVGGTLRTMAAVADPPRSNKAPASRGLGTFDRGSSCSRRGSQSHLGDPSHPQTERRQPAPRARLAPPVSPPDCPMQVEDAGRRRESLGSALTAARSSTAFGFQDSPRNERSDRRPMRR